MRALDLNYLQAQTNYNRWLATQNEVRSRTAQLDLPREGGGRSRVSLFFELLNAQRRNADAQTSYYRSIGEYNKEIADVHHRKGSLLEYNNIYMSEGPWADKAYWDAMGEAHRRDASYYLDYGWSRPSVISQGPVEQIGGGAPADGVLGAGDGEMSSGEMYPGQFSPSPAMEDVPAPTPAEPETTPESTPDREELPGPITRRPSLNEPAVMLRGSSDRAIGSGLRASEVQPAGYREEGPALR
jgi:hypothetical protein